MKYFSLTDIGKKREKNEKKGHKKRVEKRPK